MVPKVGVTIGDINGIGPEIAFKVFSTLNVSHSTPVLFAPSSVVNFYLELLGLHLDMNRIGNLSQISEGKINVLEFDSEYNPKPGELSETSGKIAMTSIELAIEACVNNEIHAMVTSPISKEAVNKAGYSIPGHTEFLAEKAGADQILMVLASKELRIALVTAHIPISEVSDSITKELVIEKATIFNESIRADFGVQSPKFAILGLNPHAGDGGVIGNEEIKVIEPAIDELQAQGIRALGPFPADGFFGQKLHQDYDGILAMYHDQGLAPFKLLAFGSGVNFTAGLPFIRTSPDHGTAFDIAGKGVANPASFIEAYNLAVELSRKK